MRPRIVLFVPFLFVFVTNIYATNPPNKGNFPNGFWKIALQDQTLLKYGDPGWVKRIEQRRLQQQASVFVKTAVPLLQTDNFVLPVLLGQYSNNAGTFTDQDFQNLLFDNNPTGTMTAYYNEVSYGQFNLTGQVYGWFTSDQTQSYYASNNNGLNSSFPRNGAGFVRNIVGKADPSVNFSLYDNDGPDGVPNSGDDDGYVDGVIVVYAGAGADWGANNNLWPHMSSLGVNEYTTNDAAAIGGMIKVSTYAVCPERAGNGSGTNLIRPIGVFAHEFGHILGLPDLYDRTDASDAPDFQSSEGIGEWCLMASGSWGGDGDHTETPAHMSAWCKVQMGWVVPELVKENSNGVMIRQAEDNAEAYMLWEDGYQMPWENGSQWTRYFLMENRQKVGFDQYLHSAGLLIFHVDENRRWGRITWSGGPVNDDETHKLVDLEEADGNADLDKSINRGDGGDPFPGTSNNRAFTDASNPNSRDYDGISTGVEVKNISFPGPTMTADLMVRQPLGYALAYDENGITGSTWGFTTARNSWSGVRFTTQQAGILTALDFGFLNPPNIYEIKVYSIFNGLQPSGLLTTVSGQATGNGWHTISIPGGVTLPANQDFFVSVKISNKAYAHSYDREGQSSGRSYFSGDGITFNNSIGTDPNGADLNIRARILQQDSPRITVTTPTEGATWTAGSSQTVTWNSHGVSGGVNIKLSTNGGSTFPITLVPNTSNDGSESITVPNNLSNLCRVRVESMSNTNVFGDNPGYFTIANLSVTITSSPSGRQIVVDGATYSAPRTFTNWSVGSQHTIGVTSPQSGASATQYVFSSWSDGGDQIHTITAPSTNTTYAANFTTQYQLTVNANPSTGGTINPSGQSWRDSGVNIPISATPNGGYYFTGWSGSATGTNNPVTVTMNAPKTVTANFAPNPSITVTTSPSGQQLVVDATTYTAPQTFTNWSVGSQHTIGVTSPQGETSDTRYVFSSWSDGGSQTHTITVPSFNITYTANFTTQYQLTVNANPSTGGTINPSGQSWRNSGVNVPISATPSSGYYFSGWSGNVAGTNNPVTVTMNAAKTVTANFATNPSISITDMTVTEGNTGTVNADFTVTLSAMSGQIVRVNYVTANGTATAGSDYVAKFGTVTFPVGATTQTITVVVNGDAVNEPDEIFFVNLSGAVNATITDAQGQGTIVNDEPPTLASPANGAVNRPIILDLSWSASTGTTTYRLQVSTISTFTTTVFDDSTLTATSQQVGPLVNNRTYYWRVKAKNAGGSSAWSSVWSFTTIIAAPTTPTLIAPANGTTNQSTTLTLSWTPATGVTTYRLQVSRNPAFTTIIFDDSTNASTSREIGPLANNTAHYWRVKAKNVGGAGAWSSLWSFTTIIAAPTAPTLISPANGAGNQSTTLTLSWNPATGATTYRLQISINSAFTTIILDDSTNAITSRQIGSLTNNKTYYWRVNAKNVGGASAWSSVWSFMTGTTAVSERGKVTPTEFSLNQNYPNPFNPSTTILYAVPKTVFVRLTVFNPLGKEVETLVSTTQAAGEYEVHWNPNNLTSGVYLYRLQAGSFTETKKLVLMR